jgi:hypothetical protein
MNKVYPFLHRNPTSGLVTQHDGIDTRLWVATHIAAGMVSYAYSKFASVEEIAASSFALADAILTFNESKPNEQQLNTPE